jgi:hypothetical protein
MLPTTFLFFLPISFIYIRMMETHQFRFRLQGGIEVWQVPSRSFAYPTVDGVGYFFFSLSTDCAEGTTSFFLHV